VIVEVVACCIVRVASRRAVRVASLIVASGVWVTRGEGLIAVSPHPPISDKTAELKIFFIEHVLWVSRASIPVE